MAKQSKPRLYSDGLEKAAWRTICNDSSNISEDGSMLFQERRAKVLEHTQTLRNLIQAGDAINRIDAMRMSSSLRIILTYLFSVLGRRLCVTGKGYFGILPRLSEEGDLICIFSGAPNPFVLRPLADSRIYYQGMKVYQLVGVCYMDGIMLGELQDMKICPELLVLK
jgi:hypothetical protein